MMLTKTIKEMLEVLKTNSSNIKIVLPEGWNKLMQEAAIFLRKDNVCDFTILIKDNSEKISELASDDGVEYINITEDSELKQKLSDQLFELRKHKGMTQEDAVKLLNQSNFFGTMLVKSGHVDGYVAGIEFSTKDTIKPALQIVKTAPGIKSVADFCFLEKEDKKYFFVNCALNFNPTAEELVDYAFMTKNFANKIGIVKPKIAFLSYSTANSGVGESADKVRNAAQLALNDDRLKDAQLTSELQFDSAIDEMIRRKKAKECEWEGQADIFLFPNLDSGNIGYKIMQRMAGFASVGPLLLGLDKPMNDLSRGSTLQDIISTIVMTATSVTKKG